MIEPIKMEVQIRQSVTISNRLNLDGLFIEIYSTGQTFQLIQKDAKLKT